MENLTNQNSSDSIKKLGELIKDIEVAMMTTSDPDGRLRSRPMGTQRIEFDGDLWFFTSRESGKVIAIENDQQVNLAYSSPNDMRYVSVTGNASIVEDRTRAAELWSPLYRSWFPKGLQDPNLVLIKVEVESAEYWDYHSSKMISLLDLAKSLIKKEGVVDRNKERHDKLSIHH